MKKFREKHHHKAQFWKKFSMGPLQDFNDKRLILPFPKHRKALLIIGFLPLLLSSACSDKATDQLVKDSQKAPLPIYYDADLEKESANVVHIATQLTQDYQPITWHFDHKDFKLASGILARDQDLIVLDGDNDCLLLLDYNGKIIKKVGHTGSGPLEFANPTALTMKDDCLYIVDGMNDRVQILDKDLNYMREIKLERKEYIAEFSFEDIAIDQNGTLYVSGNVFDHPGILYYKKDESSGHWIDAYFNGYLAELDGQVYAINSGVFSISDKSIDSFQTGENYLLKVTEEGLTRVCELPYGINSYDFILSQQELISISRGFYQLLRLSPEGAYIDSIGELDLSHTLTGHITKDKNDNYYFTDGKSNKIYVFKKGQ